MEAEGLVVLEAHDLRVQVGKHMAPWAGPGDEGPCLVRLQGEMHRPFSVERLLETNPPS